MPPSKPIKKPSQAAIAEPKKPHLARDFDACYRAGSAAAHLRRRYARAVAAPNPRRREIEAL